MPGPPIVSIHAVRRFGERALGCRDLDPSDPVALGQMRTVYNLDTGVIEALLAAIVHSGVEAGAASVKFGRHRYMLSGRVLTTVLNIPKPRRRRRIVDREAD